MTKNQTATQRLIAAAALLTATQEPFKVGDTVVWKSAALANKKLPAPNQPVVITRTFDEPLKDTSDKGGTPLFNEPLNMAAALLGSDGDLLEFHYDSRRFRLATQEEIDAWDAKK